MLNKIEFEHRLKQLRKQKGISQDDPPELIEVETDDKKRCCR